MGIGSFCSGLQGHDVGGLQTFGTSLDGELDALPFIQVFEPLALDGGVMDEHILAPSRVIKP